MSLALACSPHARRSRGPQGNRTMCTRYRMLMPRVMKGLEKSMTFSRSAVMVNAATARSAFCWKGGRVEERGREGADRDGHLEGNVPKQSGQGERDREPGLVPGVHLLNSGSLATSLPHPFPPVPS